MAAGTKVVQDIKRSRADAIFVRADVSKSADIQALVRATVDTYGRLDFAVNNAGFGGASETTGDYTDIRQIFPFTPVRRKPVM